MIKCITLLLFISFSTQLPATVQTKPEVYVDVSTNQKIKVKFKRDYIKVKYLHSKKWVKYRLVGPGTFDDYRGNKIYLREPDKLIWRSRRYGEQITFRRYDNRNAYPNSRDYSNREYKRNKTSRNLEGTWFQPKLGKEIILIDNRTGIKLRFRGERNWYYFEEVNAGIYQDKNGNTYTQLSDVRILWKDARGIRSFTLEKRSDQINWD